MEQNTVSTSDESDDKFKHSYAFIMLFLTVLWAALCLVFTVLAIANEGDPALVIAASGAGGLTGTFTTIDVLIAQHYFRRSRPQ